MSFRLDLKLLTVGELPNVNMGGYMLFHNLRGATEKDLSSALLDDLGITRGTGWSQGKSEVCATPDNHLKVLRTKPSQIHTEEKFILDAIFYTQLTNAIW